MAVANKSSAGSFIYHEDKDAIKYLKVMLGKVVIKSKQYKRATKTNDYTVLVRTDDGNIKLCQILYFVLIQKTVSFVAEEIIRTADSIAANLQSSRLMKVEDR